MTKAVVVGGSGFIGSHVADKLAQRGYAVTVFDCRPSPWLRPGQEMMVGDLRDAEAVEAAIDGAALVYNFAALADLNQALEQPYLTAELNILGNINVLEACRKAGVERFMYASTVYVYSREGGFYRCSKQASEQFVEEFHHRFGLDYTILRYGSLYGPRSDETNGLYRIVRSALESGTVRYEGSADALREYIHVEDAADASLAALSDELKNQSIVLTGQESMRVVDLLEMLAEILGLPKGSVEFTEREYAGHYVRTPYAYQPRIGKKYIPPIHVDLGQGLLQLIDAVKTDLDGKKPDQ